MDIILDTMWNGFRKLHFIFEDRHALIVIPKNRREDGKWLYKTEYFGAFPSFELEMLAKATAWLTSKTARAGAAKKTLRCVRDSVSFCTKNLD